MARTISAAICSRRVVSAGQKRGGVALESQPLMTPRAARASMATQAGSAAGTSPKRVPQGPVEGDGLGAGDGGAPNVALTVLKPLTVKCRGFAAPIGMLSMVQPSRTCPAPGAAVRVTTVPAA